MGAQSEEAPAIKMLSEPIGKLSSLRLLNYVLVSPFLYISAKNITRYERLNFLGIEK